MKTALVHDYIKEFGGAERVLKVLAEMYPESPIYTAFSVKNSTAEKEFRGKKIYESWLSPLLSVWKLYSPLRFLTPLVWGSFDLSEYDLVITSCSWYITRGFKVGPNTRIIAYCHTPPRWLYGYETSVGFTKYWPVKIYSAIVGHFMRIYDFKTAQQVNYWIANSKNIQARIEKFYRKRSTVIYPPVDVSKIKKFTFEPVLKSQHKYFLIVSRLVGAKGLEEAAAAFKNSKYKLKIVGEAAGFSEVAQTLKKLSGGNVELAGRVSDEELYKLYAGAEGFIALAKDEDFGMTVIEAQAAGTPVIAYKGGGYRESVIDGVTGIFINNTDVSLILQAVKRLTKIKWDRSKIQKNAQKFSRERFEKEIKLYINGVLKKK